MLIIDLLSLYCNSFCLKIFIVLLDSLISCSNEAIHFLEPFIPYYIYLICLISACIKQTWRPSEKVFSYLLDCLQPSPRRQEPFTKYVRNLGNVLKHGRTTACMWKYSSFLLRFHDQNKSELYYLISIYKV